MSLSLTSGNIRGVVLDIDGTLLDSAHRVPEGLKNVAERLRTDNVWLSLASARPPRSVAAIGREINSSGPFVALNGAIVFAADGHVHHRSSIPSSAARQLLVRFGASDAVGVSIYSAFSWFADAADGRIAEEARIVGFQPDGSASEGWNCAIDKLLLITNRGSEHAVCEIARGVSSEVVAIVSKPSYVEITARNVSKGEAFELAVRSVGLDPMQVLAVGDGENDASMLMRCGFPVAMAHSPAMLKKIAKKTIGTNDDGSLESLLNSLAGLS
jgi:Cof subfamily protein (haloacid dehalogenase superfamily)